MNNQLWDRIAEAAEGKQTIEAADLALALIELAKLRNGAAMPL